MHNKETQLRVESRFFYSKEPGCFHFSVSKTLFPYFLIDAHKEIRNCARVSKKVFVTHRLRCDVVLCANIYSENERGVIEDASGI